MNAPGHVDFYAIVLFIHIVAALAAFGVTFAYPLIDTVVRRLDGRSLPTYHELQIQLGRRLITPSAVVVLIAGLYLALDRWKDFSGGWWSGALVILVVLVGIEHALMIPNARQLRDRAALDVQGGTGGGTVALSTEYEQLARRRRLLGGIMQLLVVVAVFLMVVKPGA